MGLGVYRASPKDTLSIVAAALRAGYRHIDTAAFYDNEREVGRAVRESGVPRGDVFVTTKVMTWGRRTAAAASKRGKASTLAAATTTTTTTEEEGKREAIEAVDESLAKMGLEYVDLVLLHSPHNPDLRLGRWRGLEECVRAGKVRHIGVSNYGNHHLEELLRVAEIKPVVNQLEVHVFCQRPELLAFNAKHGVLVEAYSPLGKATRLKDARVGRIAAKYGKTPAQVFLRFLVQLGLVVLPKTVNPARLAENGPDVFSFELSEEDMEELRKMDERQVTGWDPTTLE